RTADQRQHLLPLAERTLRERPSGLPKQRPPRCPCRGGAAAADRHPRSPAATQGRRHRPAHGRARGAKKKSWGTLTARWVSHDLRDQVVDYVRQYATLTELPQARLVAWLGVGRSKFFDWKQRFGRVNEHNAWVPRDHRLTDDQKLAIIDFHGRFPLE